jgi:hypothetical protein
VPWDGPHTGRRPDSDRKRNDQRSHAHDEDRRQNAAHQTERPPLTRVDETGRGGVLTGVGVGKVVADSAVGKDTLAGLGSGRKFEIARGDCERVYGTGAGILSVSTRSGG